MIIELFHIVIKDNIGIENWIIKYNNEKNKINLIIEVSNIRIGDII